MCLDYLAALQPKIDGAESDEARENLILVAYLQTENAIRNSFRREPAVAKLKKIMEANDFTAWVMREDDRESMTQFDIFFR